MQFDKKATAVFLDESVSLSRVGQRIDDGFNRAVEHLSLADFVACLGVGKSGIIAEKFAASLRSIGKRSFSIHPNDALHGDTGAIQTDTCVVCISKSGNTEELHHLVPLLKRRNATIIAVVGDTNSFLALQADVVLDVSIDSEACSLNVLPTTSSTVALVMCDALLVCLTQKLQVSIESISENHPAGRLGRLTSLTVQDAMHLQFAVVSPESTMRQCVIQMSKYKQGCAIVTSGERMIGLITDGDIRRNLERLDGIDEVTAKSIMTQSPITISPEQILNEAYVLMENGDSQINVLPVVSKENQCVGILRIHDVVGR